LTGRFAESAQAAQSGQEDPMSIWGHRDSEPPAEEAHESQSPAQAPGETGAQAGPGAQAQPGSQAEEPAPAFWRAQGETPAPFGRSPADAPPLAGAAPPADAPPPAYGHMPDGAPAPAGRQPAQAPDDMVVLDGATAVKDPALTGTAGDQAGTAGDQDQAGTHGAEPAGEAQETAVPEPAVPEAVAPGPAPPEAGVPEAPEPVAAEPARPGAPPPAAPAADVPAADAPVSHAGISPERWSEILATFVDDPRGSVKMAANAVEEAIDEFVNSVRARQRALESSWRGNETDTEQLRTALRDYRRFWHQVRQLDPAGKTGA
jgi:hypothetical protein